MMYPKAYPKATKRAYRKTGITKQLATKYYVDRKIGSQIELKLFNGAWGIDTAVTTSGVVIDLTNISQGTGQGNRVGQLISPKKLKFQTYIELGESSFLSPDAWCNVRIILFRWREDSAVSTPTAADIIDNVSSTNNYSVNMPYNYNTRQKYEILSDKRCLLYPEPEYNGSALQYVAAGPGMNKIMNFVLYSKKLLKNIKYNNGTNNGYGKLYALFFSDSSSSPSPTIRYNSHLFYEDA